MNSEKGFSLAETIIALLLLGIIAVAFLGGLSTASKGIFLADERATAESLARTEMEYIMKQDYSVAPWNYTVTSSQRSSTDQPSWWSDEVGNEMPPFLSSNYDGYTVSVNTVPLRDPDDGEQKITVVVYFISYDAGEQPNRKVILEDYKSLR
jgi:prepilin-type N-terminal cleavage/methylation domain-containing protein